MSARSDYLDFYERTYPHVIEAVARGGRFCTVIRATQPSGDWSDAPIADLVLALNLAPRARGRFDLGCGRHETPIPCGGWNLVPPNTATKIETHDPLAGYLMALDYAALLRLEGAADEGLPRDGDFGALMGAHHSDAEIRGLIINIWRTLEEAPVAAGLRVDGMVLQLIARLLTLGGGRRREARGGLAGWQARQCEEYLRANLAENVSLAEVAELARLSPFHFARQFKATMGLPPAAYQRKLRLERAQEMLLGTDMEVGDIAVAVGYETPQAFARAFRQQIGASPSDWRRERRR